MDLFRLMFEKRTALTHFYSCFSYEGSKLTVTIEPPFRGTLGHQAISMHSSSLKLLHMGKKGRALYRCLLNAAWRIFNWGLAAADLAANFSPAIELKSPEMVLPEPTA